MGNQSVDDFRRTIERMTKEVRDTANADLLREATQLAAEIQAAAPVHEGVLRTTVRVIQDARKGLVRIVAGGSKTVRPAVSSKPYDYSRADEFGTVNMPAQPFFFNTYRRAKGKVRANVKQGIAAVIAKYSAEE